MKKLSIIVLSVAATVSPVSAQSPIETALTATVTIEVADPGGNVLGHGSGFITSSDGIIVTAAHVIAGASTAVVRLQNGEELPVEGVIAFDGDKDVAVLRVAGFDLPTVPLGNADDLSIGQRIIVIGAPIDQALAGTVSDGLLAADRLLDGTRTLQISAPTSPGNSGGPVLTEQGQVIGLVVSGITTEGAENLNFALPINYVRGQLALAATKALQPLSNESTRTETTARERSAPTATCSMSSGELEAVRSRAEAGDVPSQAELGFLLTGGGGTLQNCLPQDDSESLRWTRLAADQGNTQAQFSLGLAYSGGNGVPEDRVTAVRWWRLAADQGHAAAQGNLGWAYRYGNGVPEDYVTAYMWYNLAAAQGNEYGQENKETLEQQMTRSQISEGQRLSREWLENRPPGGN